MNEEIPSPPTPPTVPPATPSPPPVAATMEPMFPTVKKRMGRPPKNPPPGEIYEPKKHVQHWTESLPKHPRSYVGTEAEYLAELMQTDPVIKRLDEQINDKLARRGDEESRQFRDKLQKERRVANARLMHAARSLANVVLRIQGSQSIISCRAATQPLRYEKMKRIRYLRRLADGMKKDAARRASEDYYRTVLKKTVSAPPDTPNS